jgi:hypothetical protein
MPRIHRPVHQMAAALNTHVMLLGRYIDAVYGGDDTYVGEIAGKLRLLVVLKGKQKPLLLRLAELTGDDLTLTIEGPEEGWEYMENSKPGDVLALGDWLSSFAILAQTSEGEVRLTNAELVTTWAEQYGAAHEDWSLKEAFHLSLNLGDQMRAQWASAAQNPPEGLPPVILGILGKLAEGPPIHVLKLLEIAIITHQLGVRYLDQLTEEKLHAAENQLRQRQGRPSLEEEADDRESDVTQ